MAERLPKGRKTTWEKEKLLMRSNFVFSPSVVIRLVLQTPKNYCLFEKGFMVTILTSPVVCCLVNSSQDFNTLVE